MLDKIRKRKEHWVSVFIILAVVAVMAFFGIAQFDKGQNGANGPVAWVNGEVISQREFAQEMEFTLNQYRSMLGNQYDEKLVNALQIPQRTLERLVQYRLLTQQAKAMGFEVPDVELSEFIKALPYFQKDGKFDSALYLKLPNRGLEERRQRDNMNTQRLQTYVTDRIKLTPAELTRERLLKETQVELEYAAIDFGALAPKFTPKSTDLAALDQGAGELKDYYEAHKAEYSEKAQVELRQIRVGIAFQAPDSVRAEAQKKIDAIAAEVNATNFETVAKAKSDDEYAKKGGNLGWVTRGTLEKPLEDAIDTLNKGQVSKPISTTFGMFILQVVDKKPERVKAYDEVKNDIAVKISEDRARSKFIDEKKKEWEAILASGKPLEPELKKNKIELKKTGAFSIGQGSIPQVGQVDSMLDAIFELSKANPVPKRLFFHQDKYYYVKLVSTKVPKAEDLTKDLAAQEKTLGASIQGEVFSKWIESLEKKAKIKNATNVGAPPVS